jgi:ankyrin repeat protein
MYAACAKDPDAVRELLNAGADINLKSSHRNTALMIACGLYGTNDNIKVIQILLENGADVNVRNLDGTALDIASINGHREIVAVLFDHIYSRALAKVINRDILTVICEFV